jgi:hypothetical protein
MNATYTGGETGHDRLVGELTDAALAAAARYGVQGGSVDQELDLWHALGDVVRRHAEQSAQRAAAGTECDQLLGELVEAAYGVALARGFRGAFADVELGMWRALRRAFVEGRPAPGLCGPPASGRRSRQPAVA